MNQAPKILLGLALISGIAAAGWHWAQSSPQPSSSHATATASSTPNPSSACTSLQSVQILTGSAKFNLLEDPELQALAQAQCFRFHLTKSSSLSSDLQRANQFDVIWPAGGGAAQEFERQLKGSSSRTLMSTPLMIGTWTRHAQWMQSAGWIQYPDSTSQPASNRPPFYGVLSAESLQKALLSSMKWQDIPAAANSSLAKKSIGVNMPNIQKSSTGSLFVSLMGYVANGHDPLQDVSKTTQWAQQWIPVFRRQGFQEDTLNGPFEDYLMSQGRVPLVLMYESQWIETLTQKKASPDQVALYLNPGMMVKHTAVARTDIGRRWLDFMSRSDVQLKMAQYGFRVKDPSIHQKTFELLGIRPKTLQSIEDWAVEPSETITSTIKETLSNP